MMWLLTWESRTYPLPRSRLQQVRRLVGMAAILANLRSHPEGIAGIACCSDEDI